MSQYKIHSEHLIGAITLLRACQQQVRDAERSIYNRENPLSFQAMTDVSRILCNMKNVRQKLCRLDDDLATLQEALIYIGDKSEDADRQVSNILRGRGYMNIIDDARDAVSDFMKHFQGWFESDNKENSKESEKDNDVIYVDRVTTIVLNDDGRDEGEVQEIERVYTEDYLETQKTQYWESQVGNTVASIVDENGSFTEYYGSGNLSYRSKYEGECTWYVYGRFYEVTGIKLNQANAARRWIRDCQNDSRVKIVDYPVAGSIAVSEKGSLGHVMFIEHVTYDAQGNPEYIYYTEANVDIRDNGIENVKGKYDAGQDGVLKKVSYSEFISNWSPSGYIAAA